MLGVLDNSDFTSIFRAIEVSLVCFIYSTLHLSFSAVLLTFLLLTGESGALGSSFTENTSFSVLILFISVGYIVLKRWLEGHKKALLLVLQVKLLIVV